MKHAMEKYSRSSNKSLNFNKDSSWSIIVLNGVEVFSEKNRIGRFEQPEDKLKTLAPIDKECPENGR